MFYDNIVTASDYIKSKINIIPEIAIILGSGLGSVADVVTNKVVIDYKDIPFFPKSSVKGHGSNLLIGKIGAKNVVIMQGRFHYYEGYSMKEVAFPVYVMKMLGASSLIVTNACGAINPNYLVGDLLLIDDYINLLGDNPLMGENDERLGPRFPDMSEPYSLKYIEIAKKIAIKNDISYQVGSYALFNGPCYETKAEIRAYASMGADCVGMSTVPETIAANYLNMKVLGIGCITNMATGLKKDKHSHDAVVDIANKTSDKMARLILEFIKEI